MKIIKIVQFEAFGLSSMHKLLLCGGIVFAVVCGLVSQCNRTFQMHWAYKKSKGHYQFVDKLIKFIYLHDFSDVYLGGRLD